MNEKNLTCSCYDILAEDTVFFQWGGRGKFFLLIDVFNHILETDRFSALLGLCFPCCLTERAENSLLTLGAMC